MIERHIDENWRIRCRLCPRKCGVNRMNGEYGRCRMGEKVRVSRASLHMWEEPCITGEGGSGTVFFTGCSLGCVYCQNHEIAKGEGGLEVSEEELAGIFLDLQERGAENINLVTAAHFVPPVVDALERSRSRGLRIPVVYNSSGYELPDTLRDLEQRVDVFLPDFKYMDPDLAQRYSGAPDYPQTAALALAEMVRQRGRCVFDERGMMRSGVIVRLLLLPGHVRDACRVLDYLHSTYGDDIYISIMNQYTPVGAPKEDPLLNRRVTEREYDRLISHALSIGIENAFIQEGETAEESFIPSFRDEGETQLREFLNRSGEARAREQFPVLKEEEE